MKKEFIFITILCLLLLPSQYLITKKTLYPSHDGLYHIARISEYHKSIISGQFPPRLAPDILGGIGYPLFVVNYHLPYLFAEPFMLILNDAQFAYKAVMSITFIFSGIFAYLMFKEKFNSTASLVGAVVFAYSPYRFANLYTRGSFGESVSYMFVPLVLLSIYKINKSPEKGFILLTISLFGLISSHTLIFFIFFPVFFLHTVFLSKLTVKRIKLYLISIFIALGLSSFQLLPSILEKHYLTFNDSLLNLYSGHFISITQLFRIPFHGTNIGTSFQIGLVSSILLIAGIFSAFFKKKKLVLLYCAIFIVAIFLTSYGSKFIWSNISLIRYVLYPWRYIGVSTLSASFLAVYFIDKSKKKYLFGAVIITLSLFTSRHYFLKPSIYNQIYPTKNLTTENEFDPIWSNDNTFKNVNLFQTDRKASITNIVNKPYSLSFTLLSENTIDVLVRKLYFPGWYLFINGNNHPIKPNNGLISFEAPSGISSVALSYKGTHLEHFSNLLTIITSVLFLALALKLGQKKGVNN